MNPLNGEAPNADTLGAPMQEPSTPHENPLQANIESRSSDLEEVKRLSDLSPFDYDRVRKEEAKKLGVQVSTLDRLVRGAKGEEEKGNITFDEVEPWPDPVDLSTLLSDLSATVRRFIVCAEETADAAALWVAFTWFIDVVQVAPFAVITAPEKRCGKTQLLTLLQQVVCKPLMASNISPAAFFRTIDAWSPTLLIDEVDAFMRDNEELRGIVNAGHTRSSAYTIRTVGDNHTPTRFSLWGAKALSGIGHLADTIMDRSITLVLRRKLPNENTERLRYAETGLFPSLASRLARCAEDCREAVRSARPDLPASLHDRAQDNWEPLLAIADIAGGIWPDKARRAALTLSGAESPLQSIGTELLADIQEIFDAKRADKISTADLIQALCADDEKSWATYNRGKPISPRQVSSRLKEYGIISKTIRIGYGNTPKGFTLDQFKEAFSRYLTSPPEISATVTQPYSQAEKPVADSPTRCENENQNATPKPATGAGCGGVADKKGGWEVSI
ncbi:DUF3631 domain-containing protein [bacterium]|nr:MAG: DUF3631 domain-containing protein [bacterium]